MERDVEIEELEKMMWEIDDGAERHQIILQTYLATIEDEIIRMDDVNYATEILKSLRAAVLHALDVVSFERDESILASKKRIMMEKEDPSHDNTNPETNIDPNEIADANPGDAPRSASETSDKPL